MKPRPSTDAVIPAVLRAPLLVRVMVGAVFLFARVAAVPLVAVMLVAIVSTKVPILMRDGFWAMAHEARTDWSMLLGSLFLAWVGPGMWSLDHWHTGRRARAGE